MSMRVLSQMGDILNICCN